MAHSLRIALVRPPAEILYKFSKPVESLALAYLASSLSADGHEPVMLDGMLMKWSESTTALEILRRRPDIVGFTTVLQYFPENLKDIIGKLRDGGFSGLIVVGGHAVSFIAERVLRDVPEIDAVVSGEGESALVAIARALAANETICGIPGVYARRDGKVVGTKPQRQMSLDSLPNPARDLTASVIAQDGLVAMSTSRGCYARCTFCSVPRFYGLSSGEGLSAGDWLPRDPILAADELAKIHALTGALEVLIVDDEFFGGTGAGIERARRFARAVEEHRLPTKFALSCRAENVEQSVLEQLQRAGLSHVFVGLEAGNDRDLKLYGKGHSTKQNREAVAIIKSAGLSFQPGFMAFHYASALRDIEDNFAFLGDIGELKPVTMNSAMDPHFGTPITTAVRRAGLLVERPLRMDSQYIDRRVALLKEVAERSAVAFQTHMGILARVRSAITWEWRRTIPWRREIEEKLLDRFEEAASAAYASIVTDALGMLKRADPLFSSAFAQEMLDEIDSLIGKTAGRLNLQQALLLQHLSEVEGSLRYVTQMELIQGSPEGQ